MSSASSCSIIHPYDVSSCYTRSFRSVLPINDRLGRGCFPAVAIPSPRTQRPAIDSAPLPNINRVIPLLSRELRDRPPHIVLQIVNFAVRRISLLNESLHTNLAPFHLQRASSRAPRCSSDSAAASGTCTAPTSHLPPFFTSFARYPNSRTSFPRSRSRARRPDDSIPAELARVSAFRGGGESTEWKNETPSLRTVAAPIGPVNNRGVEARSRGDPTESRGDRNWE